MSKKSNQKQSNTLLNYFQSPTSKSSGPNGTPSKSKVMDERPQKMEVDPDSEDEQLMRHKKKRPRIIDSDSDNGDSEMNTAGKSGLKKFTKKVKKEMSNGDTEDSPPKAEGSVKVEGASVEPPANKTQWVHEKLDFLKPENICDAQKRKRTHPEYDPRTLYVPESYLQSVTPAMRQWWVLKSRHFDTVLFFKVGKFYELYHMDAVVGVNHLGFTFMKQAFAHSGFPEIAYGRMAQALMDLGFKVARCEQTETPEMMEERCRGRKTTKFDKVVNREVCLVTTKGSCSYGPQLSDAKNPLPAYMLAIAEKAANENGIRYGVCFVDTSIGTFHIAEFLDDKQCSKLFLLLSEHHPALILTERNKTSNITYGILQKSAGSAHIEKLSSSTQFYAGDKTLQKLQEGSYFKNQSGEFAWPKVLCDFIEQGSPKPGCELALSALGACLWYLKDSLMDIQIFTMGKFEVYEPFSNKGTEFLILDAVTIENLNLLGKTGTMQNTLDLCCTAFGKRLLQLWICRPLCNIEKIRGRQEAVQELYCRNEYLQSARDILKKLPDLERQISMIHTFGNKQFAEKHPDSRAIFYEAHTYFKRKILALISTLKGFERAMGILEIFNECDSKLLRKITHCDPDGLFFDLSKPLQYFKVAFDQEEAEKEGKIIPKSGVDDDYDNAELKIKEINHELEEYLQEQKNFFNCPVNYFGTDKKRFQLEIPESKCKKVTADYTLEGTRKGTKPVKRYSTCKTKELLAKMMKAEADRANILEDLNRRIFEKFGEWYEKWDQVVRCLSMLDILCSLAEYARTYSQDVCLPKILPFTDEPYLRIENGRHACIPKVDDYVPNDTELGTKDKPAILILTGPNMGGKSTLMRQVALIIVMAQIGSYVPASACELTLIDRIFTRLGAQDDIMTGQSTFLVEMFEASAILQDATKHSFVLLDELGRGTSTHDGNAIATAYMKKLLEINCRVIYSTHYHTLVEYYGGRTDIQLGHMACLIEGDSKTGNETVTFLYKIEPGVCSNSYGFNVAKLAGLPSGIVDRAREVANRLEDINKARQLFIKLFSTNKASTLRDIIRSVKTLKSI